MKKLLIASTALIATASVVGADVVNGNDSAEVTFDGYGRFGLVYQDTDSTDSSSTRIEQRFRLNVSVLNTTDGGVQFGARIRFQSDDSGDDDEVGNGGVAENSAAEFNVESGGFRLDVGNTSDVLDSGDVIDYFGNTGVGLTDFGEISSGFGLPVSGFGTGDESVAPTIKARYAVDAFTFAASYTTNAEDDADEEWQIGVGYQINSNLKIGAAYGELEIDGAEDEEFAAIGLHGSAGAITYDLLIADTDRDNFDTAFGIGLGYDLSAATDLRFVVSDNGEDDNDTAYSVGFRHNLGGGVTLRGGVGEDSAGDARGDLGVRFDF
ncbi:porin [uncultured Roseobacter sp.]|uniref:porin n=1 Tax=uncultured Roseobacter sp. TaxID=114847 RepID=UPI002624789C|nr:porin [uncultured Roseobacter sp.]